MLITPGNNPAHSTKASDPGTWFMLAVPNQFEEIYAVFLGRLVFPHCYRVV